MSILWLNPVDTSGVEDFAQAIKACGWSIQGSASAKSAMTSLDIEVTSGTEADIKIVNLFGHKDKLEISSLESLDNERAVDIRLNAAKTLVSSIYYKLALEEIQRDGKLSTEYSNKTTLRAIRHLAYFDTKLDEALSPEILNEEVLHLNFGKGTDLRYGENSHQDATFFSEHCANESSLANAKQLWGKELSFNNIVDADAALEMTREFAGSHAVSIIKHLNPCGLATGATIDEAFEAAWDGDPVSAFGSVIACSSKVDLATAERLKGRFVEILLAPGFDPEAVELLSSRSKNIRILEIKSVEKAKARKVYKHVIGGLLVQDRDVESIEKWECVTKTPFPENKAKLANFTWLVTKHTKSNAIVMCQEYNPGYYKILGLGPGQPNRIDSNLRLCQPRVRDNMARMDRPEGVTAEVFEKEVFGELVMGSDAFFPFADNIESAHAAGLKYIVQPGGSMRDDEVIAKCDELGVSMICTGMRHFRH